MNTSMHELSENEVFFVSGGSANSQSPAAGDALAGTVNSLLNGAGGVLIGVGATLQDNASSIANGLGGLLSFAPIKL